MSDITCSCGHNINYHHQKWIKTRKGGKPAPAVALPYAASVMRNAAGRITAALAAAVQPGDANAERGGGE